MVNMNDFDLKELQEKYPEAYAALPSSYQNDSCLIFFIDVNGNLCCEHDMHQEFMFTNGAWVQIG